MVKLRGSLKKIIDYMVRHRIYFMTGAVGAISFIMIYGIHILNPCYTDWLLNGLDGDLSQHYLGWKFFRTDNWNFPIGIMKNIAYPNEVSVIFTDSIPLFAVFFKLFRFFLPEQFQYFGLWGLCCFILQASLASGILRKYVKDEITVVLSSFLFVLAPVFIDRMYWMTSLASQWLCLLGILFIEEQACLSEGKPGADGSPAALYLTKGAVAWTVLGALCASIHIYFLPMCGILLIGYCAAHICRTKTVIHSLTVLAGYLAGACIVIALLGGFSSDMGAAFYGLGDYSFNLNGFANPTGRFYFWSHILSDLPQYIDNQYEGFAYLGLGTIVLLGITLTQVIGNIKEREKFTGKKLAYIIVFILALIAAASPVITWNEKILMTLPIPGFIRTIWEVFRASGRLIWPAVYLLVVWAVAGDSRYIKREVKIITLAVCLLLQVYDMKDVIIQKRSMFQTKIENNSLLKDNEWNALAQKDGIKHIIFMSDFVPDQKLLFSFADYATDFGITINDFYFARPIKEKTGNSKLEKALDPAEDTVFVYYRQESQNCLAYDMNYYEIDGLIVGSIKELSAEKKLAKSELSKYYFKFGDNKYVNNGEDIDGSRYLHSYGNSYGPYLKAEPGTYRVKIIGSNLKNVDLQCYYARGDSAVEIQNLQITDTEIAYRIELTETVQDLEFLVWNIGTDDMTLNSIEVERIF